MKTLTIRLDFLAGPVWKDVYDPVKQRECTGIRVVDDDANIAAIDAEIQQLYTSYFEFDSHNAPCWFNEEKARADKGKMLGLMGKLNKRLAQIDDGSFIVKDEETRRLQAL